MDGLLGIAGMICLTVSQWIIPEISLRLASFSTYWSRFFWMKNRDRNIFFDMKKWSLKSAIFKYHLRIPQLHPSLLRFFSYPTWQEPWRIFPYVFPLSHLICALLIGGFKAFFLSKNYRAWKWHECPCHVLVRLTPCIIIPCWTSQPWLPRG